MKLFRLLSTLLGFAALTTAAFADPPRPSHDHWRNTDYAGHYVLYDRASNSYIETVGCRAAWRFTLVRNETNAIELYDASRGMGMRLDYDGMWLKPAGQADWSLYQRGTFDTRKMFYHNDVNGNFTGTVLKSHGCEWQEWFPGVGSASFRFVERNTTRDAVELYDGSRDLWVKLDATHMYLRTGANPYGFFKGGHW